MDESSLAMRIQMILNEGKRLIVEQKYEEAIKIFAEMGYLSDQFHRMDASAVSKYYTSLCLSQLGHIKVAIELLRESSKHALDIKNPMIAIHSEMLRACLMSEQGEHEEVREILNSCRQNFCLIL